MLRQMENNENFSKDIIEIIHHRRSIRKFLDKDIPEPVIRSILEAGIRAPFAAQLYSLVYTTDPEKIRQYKAGVYPTTKLLIVFLVDFRKIEKIIEYKGYQYNFDDSMTLWLALQDASLVAQNIILAAEAFGLGSVLLGATPLHSERICDVFSIPQDRVYPMVGLCLGYPDPKEGTMPRPRYPLKHIAFRDHYRDLEEDDIRECMEIMDAGYLSEHYYEKLDAKIPLDPDIRDDTYNYSNYSWSEHIVRKVIQGAWSDESLLEKLRKFNFKIF